MPSGLRNETIENHGARKVLCSVMNVTKGDSVMMLSTGADERREVTLVSDPIGKR
jgi:hypothetical protein